MKRILLTLGLCATASLAYGQGNVAVTTYAKDAYAKFSNTVAKAWCSGNTAVTWGLYYGPAADNMTGLIVNPAFGFGTGGFSGHINSASSGGSTTRTLADVNPPYTTTYFQLKAWSVGYSSWEAAKASGLESVLISKETQTLKGSVIPVSTTGTPSAPIPPNILWNIGSASAAGSVIVELVPVPEPSIIALAGLGLASLIFIRRRK